MGGTGNSGVDPLLRDPGGIDPDNDFNIRGSSPGIDAELWEEVESLLSRHQQAAASFIRLPDRAAGGAVETYSKTASTPSFAA